MGCKKKKGQVAIMFTYIIVTSIVVLIAAVFAPMGVLFNAKMYEAGEDIMIRANTSIQSIQNDTMRIQIQDTIGSAVAASQNNIEVNSFIFQYGWVFVIGITLLVLFLLSRALVEFGRGGMGFV